MATQWVVPNSEMKTHCEAELRGSRGWEQDWNGGGTGGTWAMSTGGVPNTLLSDNKKPLHFLKYWFKTSWIVQESGLSKP